MENIFLLKLLFEMGGALADKNYVWGTKQKTAFNKAVRFLEKKSKK